MAWLASRDDDDGAGGQQEHGDGVDLELSFRGQVVKVLLNL